MLTSSLILGDVLSNRCSQVLYRCLEEVGSMKGMLYLRIPAGGNFQLVSFYGWPRGTRPPVSIPEDHPLTVRAQRERRTFAVNDALETNELAAFGQGGERPRYLITPVYFQGDWVGLLIQRDPIKGGTFDADRDGPHTMAICEDLTAALREFRLYGGPGVGSLQGSPARPEGPTEDVEAVSIAALLHDVSLLLLDPQMLAKPKLTEEEMKKVRNHPELAGVFLKDLRFPYDVLKLIRHHHERWDGQGYPDGLRETAIPMGSRIIGLIDAYETMTSDKSHRRPKGFGQVRADLLNGSGGQFDPALVEAFFKLMTREGGRA